MTVMRQHYSPTPRWTHLAHVITTLASCALIGALLAQAF